MPQVPKIQSGGPKDLRFFVVKLASDGERNLIGRRTESNRTADGIRLDGGRNPIGRRSVQNVKTTATTLVLPNNNKNK